MSWLVLYTKPRSEKKATAHLQKLEITTYCPLLKELRQWSDRKKKVEVPLLPSYIFVQVAEKDRDLVFQSPFVVRYLYWLKKPAIVHDKEIRVLQDYLKNDNLVAEIENIRSGDTIVLDKGHFKGKEGVVEEVGKNRLQLVLRELGVKVTLTKQGIA